MRLLFDEHLSGRLPNLLADLYPDSLQVGSLALDGAPDEAIWRAAAERGCLLVTKDEDFHRLSVLRGAPPKVVWLRLGNCTTDDVARLLREQVDAMREFALHEEATYLELGTLQQR